MKLKLKYFSTIIDLLLEEHAPRDQWLRTREYVECVENNRIVKNIPELNEIWKGNITRAGHTVHAILHYLSKKHRILERGNRRNREYYIPHSYKFKEVEIVDD